jgi:hypothetical protein
MAGTDVGGARGGARLPGAAALLVTLVTACILRPASAKTTAIAVSFEGYTAAMDNSGAWVQVAVPSGLSSPSDVRVRAVGAKLRWWASRRSHGRIPSARAALSA